jgi:hypothetical protein
MRQNPGQADSSTPTVPFFIAAMKRKARCGTVLD